MAFPDRDQIPGVEAARFSNICADLVVPDIQVPHPRETDEIIYKGLPPSSAVIEVVQTLLAPAYPSREITVIEQPISHSPDGPVDTIGTLIAEMKSRDYTARTNNGVEHGIHGCAISLLSSFRGPGVLTEEELISDRFFASGWLVGQKFSELEREVYKVPFGGGMSVYVSPVTFTKMNEIASAVIAV